MEALCAILARRDVQSMSDAIGGGVDAGQALA